MAAFSAFCMNDRFDYRSSRTLFQGTEIRRYRPFGDAPVKGEFDTWGFVRNPVYGVVVAAVLTVAAVCTGGAVLFVGAAIGARVTTAVILAAEKLHRELVIAPRQYVFDTLCGKNPDEGWEGWLKVSLSLLQMLTGIPVYTAAERTEKDITQLKEAATRFMEKLPKTPEELQNRIEEAVPPEEWETILRNTLNRLEEQAKASCTEENMEKLCYDAGYAEGTVIGILLEELFEFALGAELSTWITKGADAADTAGDLAKLDIGELPDAGDVRKIKDAAEGVIGEAAEEVVEKNLDDVAEVVIEGSSSTIHNDILDSPRTGSALKVDEIKPTYAFDLKTGRTYMVQEFPAGAQAHGFNNIVDNYAGYATKTSIENGVLYQLEGSLNGVSGRFEWIIQNGQVTHRMFIQNGTMNGVPIKP